MKMLADDHERGSVRESINSDRVASVHPSSISRTCIILRLLSHIPHSDSFAMYAFEKLPEMEGRYICDGEVLIKERLGFGGWGIVYKGETTGDITATVAVKFIPRKGLSDYQRTLLENEVDYHRKVSGTHKSILDIHGCFDDEDFDALIIITEFCPLGDLHKSAFKNTAFRGETRLTQKCFTQILDGVQAMHDLGVFHRDLKPENIFFRHDGYPVIGDFGFATCEEETDDIGMGTEHYMSPELQNGHNYDVSSVSSRASDIWALGIILFNMVTGEQPWKRADLGDEDYMHFFCKSATFFTTCWDLTPEANRLFRSIFMKVEEDRITLPELRKRVLDIKSFGPGLSKRRNTPVSPSLSQISLPTFPIALGLHVVNGEAEFSDSDVSVSQNDEGSRKSFPRSQAPERRCYSTAYITSTRPISVPSDVSGALYYRKPSEVSSHTDSDSDYEGPETPVTFAQEGPEPDLHIDALDIADGKSEYLPVRWRKKTQMVQMEVPDTFDLTSRRTR